MFVSIPTPEIKSEHHVRADNACGSIYVMWLQCSRKYKCLLYSTYIACVTQKLKGWIRMGLTPKEPSLEALYNETKHAKIHVHTVQETEDCQSTFSM